MVVFIKKGPGVTLACSLTNTPKYLAPSVLTPLLQFLLTIQRRRRRSISTAKLLF
ncbi:hypothetical protein BDZ91DRAFT_716910, partial [Kalaharituber pfeilii]